LEATSEFVAALIAVELRSCEIDQLGTLLQTTIASQAEIAGAFDLASNLRHAAPRVSGARP